MTDLRNQLDADVSVVAWEHLRPHHERGAVVLIDEVLEVATVAAALVRDDTETVAGWLQTGLVRRTLPEDDTRWTRVGGTFQFLIVQPWVLCRELGTR